MQDLLAMKQRKCSLQLSSVKVHSITGLLQCAILFDNQDMFKFLLNLQVVRSG